MPPKCTDGSEKDAIEGGDTNSKINCVRWISGSKVNAAKWNCSKNYAMMECYEINWHQGPCYLGIKGNL